MERQRFVSDIPPHRELLGGEDGYDLFFPVRDSEALAEMNYTCVELARTLPCGGLACPERIIADSFVVRDREHGQKRCSMPVSDAPHRGLPESRCR